MDELRNPLAILLDVKVRIVADEGLVCPCGNTDPDPAPGVLDTRELALRPRTRRRRADGSTIQGSSPPAGHVISETLPSGTDHLLSTNSPASAVSAVLLIVGRHAMLVARVFSRPITTIAGQAMTSE